MNKVQTYLYNKKLKELNLPPIWIVKADRNGVYTPMRFEISDIPVVNANSITYKFISALDFSYPFEIEIPKGKTNARKDGHGTGFDTWSWSYYFTFSKDDAWYFHTCMENEYQQSKIK